MNLRTKMTRHAVIAGMFGATTALAVPQAMASAAPAGAVVAASPSPGKLGRLTDLVIERLLVSDDVAASKFGTDSPIEDPVREQQVLDQVRQQAGAVGVDPDAAVAFFRDQITASKVVQKGLFTRWTTHPDEAPTTRPDLAEIRQRLDRLTTELLDGLRSTEHVRTKPVACSTQLTLATTSAATRQHLDALHRRALTTATTSVCRPVVRTQAAPAAVARR
ncbi:chorismate mutase [Nonomuraea sp. NPDC004580]|uniref:chorismate mutase n=1 Tax=Nonomuraea sp. NPDC004580 TaxID=3154552 RepID=UPI0033B3CA07